MLTKNYYTTVLLLLLVANVNTGRADIEDDISCVCGLNKEILDKIESIVLQSNQSSCPNSAQSREVSKIPLGSEGSFRNSTTTQSSENNSNLLDKKDPQNQEKSNGSTASDLSAITSESLSTHPTHLGVDSSTNTVGDGDQGSVSQDIMLVIAKLSADIHRLETQLQLQNLKPNEDKNNLPSISVSNQSQQTNRPSSSDQSSQDTSTTSQPTSSITNNAESSGSITNADFLTGLQKVPIDWNNEAIVKLNQSQTVKPEDMASALESTVPNVVSNIFFNIKNLTTQTEQNLHNNTNANNDPNSGKLTSIDGSSVSIVGDSSAQITAQGEKLFLLWIEHQIESLHLTASAANYIRKSALNLFRRIVNQYVERIQRLGGSVEQNVQRATQMALNNTQTLISFILRNYLNFAGGLMQIIGEQVSRIGKQLDSTGETIAHISLNPFDIVSNVMESLPNPSEYAKYFRAFGKQLIGEITSFATGSQQTSSELDPQTGEIKQSNLTNPTQSSDVSNKNNGEQHHAITSNHRPHGLISSLGKTLSSWIG